MSLQTTIKDGVKDAMKNKDMARLTVLRGLSSAFMNEAVNLTRGPQGELSDEEVIAVITREAKRRKDSINQYTEGGREDLAADEKAELAILEEFLPTMMSIDEIRPLAEAKKAELGADDKTKLGQLVGALMKDLKGKANGDDVKTVVESLFN
ncbi:MAG: GatB/YqeY domain-containing protein [bacterium]